MCISCCCCPTFSAFSSSYYHPAELSLVAFSRENLQNIFDMKVSHIYMEKKIHAEHIMML